MSSFCKSSRCANGNKLPAAHYQKLVYCLSERLRIIPYQPLIALPDIKCLMVVEVNGMPPMHDNENDMRRMCLLLAL